jgi:hypothetical protein
MHRHHGMILNPALLALLALGAGGCPDDPEPACKKGECPVNDPAPDDPSVGAPPSRPLATPARAPNAKP